MNIKTISKLKQRFAFALCCLMMIACTGLYAQSGISVNFKNAPLKTILEDISRQSKYRFVYTEELKVYDIKVSIESQDEAPDKLFANLFIPIEISYVIKDSHVILGLKKQGTQRGLQLAPSVKITGKVTDETGEPLPGVTIRNKSTKKMAASDIDGNYSIEAKEGDLLSFSSIGMADYELPVGKGSVLNVMMKPDAIALEDVVVTGYQTISKERATGAFVKVSSEKLIEHRLNDLSTIMDGQVAGFNNGVIRGTTTMKGVVSPLYVIDGFPVENTRYTNTGSLIENLPDLNLEDIESITVLKDAAATSIYGARAANGVVVIVTKKAARGKTEVSFSANLTVSPYKFYTDRLTNSADIIDLEREWASQNSNLKGDKAAGYAANLLSNAVYNNAGIKTILQGYTGALSNDQVEGQLNALSERGYNYYDDIAKYAKRTAIYQQYNISVGKATETNTFNFSGTYKHDRLEDKYSNNDYFGLNFMNSTKITKWLTFDISNYVKYGTSEEQSYNTFSPGYSYLPYDGLVNADGFNYTNTAADRFSEDKQNTIKKYGLYSMNITPLDEIGMNIGQMKSFSNRTQAKLSIKFCDWLKYSAMFQYEYGDDRYSVMQDKNSYNVRNLINNYATYTPQTGVVYNMPYGNTHTDRNQVYNAYNFRQQLDFNKIIAGKHDITAILGTETRHVKNEYSVNTVYNYDPEMLSSSMIDASKLAGITSGLLGGWNSFANPNEQRETVNRFVSIYGNAAYTYNSKYSVTGSLRWDRSNLWGTDSKYQNKPLWSVGASWNIDKERFMEGAEWVDMLKLRASYGIGGNISKNSAPYLTANYRPNTTVGGMQGSVGSRPNPMLSWEKTITTNIGLDFALLNNRLSGTAEFYNKLGKDLLASTMGVPTEGFGYSTYSMNNGQMRNRGFELTLAGDIIRKKDFNWSAQVLYAYNNNKVTYVNVEAPVYYLMLDHSYAYPRVGYSYNSLYGYEWAGLNNKGLPQVYNEKSEATTNTPTTLDAIINLGSLDPTHTGSFSSSLRYKNFSFSFMLIFEGGHKMWNTDLPYLNSAYGVLGYATTIAAVNKEIVNRWKNPGDEAYTNIPKAVFAEDPGYNSNSYTIYSKASVNVLNATNLRISNISFAYQIPKNICKKAFMSGARVQFNIENLYTFAANKNARYLLGGYNSPSYVFGLYFNF
ncbi:MAG: SusC/RagA family TonB-linked outer membrane protein [Bacteroidales bacterium]